MQCDQESGPLKPESEDQSTLPSAEHSNFHPSKVESASTGILSSNANAQRSHRSSAYPDPKCSTAATVTRFSQEHAMAAVCMEPMVSPIAECKGPSHSKPADLLLLYVEPDGQHTRGDTGKASLVFRGGTCRCGSTCDSGGGGGAGNRGTEHTASQPSSM